jgi:hypothetical protein
MGRCIEFLDASMDKNTVLSLSSDQVVLASREVTLRNGGMKVISVNSPVEARLKPSANNWLRGRIACYQSHYQHAMNCAVRSPDPYQKIWGSWLLRRLSPDSNPIKIEESGKRDEDVLLHAMGCEAANVHLGTRRRTKVLLKDL